MGVSFDDATTSTSAATDYNTDYIGNLDASELLTEAEIKKILKGFDQKIAALVHGGGPTGIVPYEEGNGETGFKVDPATGLEALLKAQAHYREMLNDPNYVPAFQGQTQWDNPAV